MQKKNLPSIIVNVFLFGSFLAVTIFHNFGYLIYFLSLFSALLFFSSNDKILVFHEDKKVIYLFYLFFWGSFAFVGLFNMLICKISYIEFYPSIIGRLINMVILSIMFLFIINGKNRNNFSTRTMLKAYLGGCSILLLFGVWQLSNNLFGIPYPAWTTRGDIHSMEISNLPSFMTTRITSIAREPAYLVPFIIDAIIILSYTSRNYFYIFISLIIVFFTLSLSGYMAMFLIGVIMLAFSRNSKKIIAGSFFVVPGIWMIYRLHDVFIAVFNRIRLENLLTSTRLRVIILSIKYMFSDVSIFNKLFGFGPKGMGYIRQFVFYPSGYLQGEPIAVTTNSVLFDFFVEHGIVGFAVIIGLFCYLYKMGTLTYKITKNRLSQVLCLNLFTSSLYTADFASPRFTIIIIFILCLYKDAVYQK
jgi:hypothetical protein